MSLNWPMRWAYLHRGWKIRENEDVNVRMLPLWYYAQTRDLDKYTDVIVSAISTAADKAIPKSKSVRSESNPISDETIAIIKEKRRLRGQ